MNALFDYSDRKMFADQYEQVATYKELGIDKGEYFALLDRFIFEDDFWDILGTRCVEKMMRHYRHIGDVIANSFPIVGKTCRLRDSDIESVRTLIDSLGLDFATDTTSWQAYRLTKQPYFRLASLSALGSPFDEEVRRCCGPRFSPPHMSM